MIGVTMVMRNMFVAAAICVAFSISGVAHAGNDCEVDAQIHAFINGFALVIIFLEILHLWWRFLDSSEVTSAPQEICSNSVSVIVAALGEINNKLGELTTAKKSDLTGEGEIQVDKKQLDFLSKDKSCDTKHEVTEDYKKVANGKLHASVTKENCDNSSAEKKFISDMISSSDPFDYYNNTHHPYSLKIHTVVIDENLAEACPNSWSMLIVENSVGSFYAIARTGDCINIFNKIWFNTDLPNGREITRTVQCATATYDGSKWKLKDKGRVE